MHLERSNRLQLLMQKIESELPTTTSSSTESSSSSSTSSTPPVIFCLQEVSHDWVGPLHTFFANRGFHMVTALYGRKFNGYMGIATAYPMNQFETLNVDIHRLSDKREGGWPRPPLISKDESSISKRLKSVLSTLSQKLIPPILRTIVSSNNSNREDQNPWERSEYRSNKFVAIRLLRKSDGEEYDDSKPFWIGNYHMPCAFREPAVMTIHAEMVAHRIQQLAKQSSSNNNSSTGEADDYILAGDFNILPESPHYQLLTTGKFDDDPVSEVIVDEDDEHTPTTNTTAATSSTTAAAPSIYPPIFHNVEWKSNIDGMRSAYSDHQNQEPEFTNYAFVGDQEEAFVGTLDYIFLSNNWKVLDTKMLPSREDVITIDNPSFPNAEEPSDHFLISATLEL